jgi:Rho-binding antiterminator
MEKYIPINCNYYDELEAYATLRKNVLIRYRENGTDIQEKTARIVDFQFKEKVEFMLLDDDTAIRLDWLISVDGKVVPLAC